MLFDGTRPWLDPAATGLNRLPVRPATVPCPDAVTARRLDPAESPWWLCLDGTWEFRMLAGPGQLTRGHLGSTSAPDSIDVPGAWTTQGFGNPHYTNVVMPFPGEPPSVPDDNPTGVYRREVKVPRGWAGRRCVLRVGGAESMVFVYVDGEAVGYSTDSRLPAEFDLSPHVRAGHSHTLALVVVKWSAQSWVEDQDQWWHGGLQRSVTLHSTAESHLASVALTPGLVSLPRASRAAVGSLAVEVAVDGPARSEPGWSVEVRVEGRRRNLLAGTGRVALPHWDDTSKLAQLGGAMFTEPGTLRTTLEVPEVEPWSAESPVLHTALVVLRYPGGAVVEVNALRTGFRSVEVADRELRVNGAPVIIRGVNIHEHDPLRGRAVSRDQTRRDLCMIKAANLNAVRAAHYPHDEHFAELCDELGLYVVDEANVESHARQWSLCHDSRYVRTITERVERMARRDVHHPSVILWSLGNESGYGPAHDEAAAFLRRFDPSRPLQYEGPFMYDLDAEAPVSDVVCPMYTSPSEIVDWAERARDPLRPLILCEYSHAMGNACGSLHEYDDAFESQAGLQGGFIWEWVEHGLALGEDRGPDGAPSWGYGGDFGDDPEEGNFVLDGLVGADREERPVLTEVRWLGRPVRCVQSEVAERSAALTLANTRWFTDTSDLVADWELTADGEVVAAGDVSGRPIAPRSQRTVKLRWPASASRRGAEHHLTLRWRQLRATPWAPKGALVGWEQLEVPVAGPPVSRSGDDQVEHASSRRVRRDLPAGFETEWTPTLFRALTDNDGISQGWMRGLNGSLNRWVNDLGLDRCRWEPEAGELRPAVDAPPMGVDLEVEELVDSWHRYRFVFELPTELADPPRLGVVWRLPAALDQLKWFGDGPAESYPDRRCGALVGQWSSTVADQYVGYGMPQEHGHHTGMRWVALQGSGVGVLVGSNGTGGFSARHHSDSELWEARHTGELAGAADAASTWLAVDVAQRGLGQSSLGEETRAKYRIAAGSHTMDLLVRGLGPREDPAVVWAGRPRLRGAGRSSRQPR